MTLLITPCRLYLGECVVMKGQLEACDSPSTRADGRRHGQAPLTVLRPSKEDYLSGHMEEGEHASYLETATARVLTKGKSGRLTFGTIFDRCGLAAEAWKEHEHIFAVEGSSSESKAVYSFDRVSKRTMRQMPKLDVLLVAPPRRHRQDRRRWADRWVHAVAEKGWRLRPSYILLVSDPGDILFRKGAAHRNVVKNVASCGYSVREWVQDATMCGAALDQQRWVTAFTLQDEEPIVPPCDVPLPSRPMRNLLKPPGLVPRHLWDAAAQPSPPEMEYPQGSRGARVLGQFGQSPIHRVYDSDAPMPLTPHAYVRDSERGIRPIMAEEYATALGHPDPCTYSNALGLPHDLHGATAMHVWHTLLGMLPELRQTERRIEMSAAEAPVTSRRTTIRDWDWQLPDMSEDSEWFLDRLDTLRQVTEPMQDKGRLRQEGLATLRRHVCTLTGGKTTLNLLWWEWPPTHWTLLRDGCPLHFLVAPDGGVVPNPPMDADQLETAVEFVDELIALGLLRMPVGLKRLASEPCRVRRRSSRLLA